MNVKMIAQNINMKLEGNFWIAFQLYTKRVVGKGVSERTPEIIRELIKETPEYSKIMGIPAVQEQPAPVGENLSSVNGKKEDTDSSPKSQ